MWALRRSSLIVLVALWTAAAGLGGVVSATAQGEGEEDSGQSSYTVSPYPIPCPDPGTSSLAFIRRLPDGASVCVNRKCITRVYYDHIYIEEADRSAGIRVNFGQFFPPEAPVRGNLVSFSAIVGTASGERLLYVTTDITCDTTTHATIGALGMATSAIMGWPLDYRNPDGARVQGLMPTGLAVKVAGRVTASGLADDEGYYFYLDDGWQKKDGSAIGAAGIRIYSGVAPVEGDFAAATGVLGAKMVNTSAENPTAQDLAIPVIRCNYDQDPGPPGEEPRDVQYGVVSGRVRLVGQTAPGRTVRVCTQNQAVMIPNVTDEFSPFTLTRIPPEDPERDLHGGLITASAKGYASDSRAALSGDTNVDFELQETSISMEAKSDKAAIATCSAEQALISAMLRDCEGKGLPGRQVKISTSRGSFVGAGEHPTWVVKTTDESGFAVAPLVASPDSAGIAVVTATDHPGQTCSNRVSVMLCGPDIAMTANPRYMTSPDASAISAQVTNRGVPIPSASVTFKTDLGVFQETNTSSFATTADSYGVARATLLLSAVGTARAIAIYTNSCQQKTVSWTVVAYKAAPWVTPGIQYSNPLIADLDGNPDGKREIVVVRTDGHLTALTSTGSVYWSKQYHLPGNNSPSCAVIPTERSGRPCVFIPAESQQRMFGFAYDGSPLAGWPAGTNYRFIRAAATVEDANLDGAPEILAGDECCYVFSWNPAGDWKRTGTADSSFLFRNLTASASTTIYNTTCAVGDVVGNPYPAEYLGVYVGSNHSTALFGFPGDAWGDFIGSALYLDGFPKSAGGRVETSPAIGDIDGDGRNDLAVGSDGGSLYILSSLHGTWKGYPTGGMVKSSPAIADLNGDGKLESVVVGSDSGRVFAFDALGQPAEGWDGGIKLNTSGDYPVESSPIVADVTGDGKVDVIVGCNDGNLYAIYGDGAMHTENGSPTGPIAWIRCCIPPTEATAQVLTSPVVEDVDNDGKTDVLAASDKGIYLFRFSAPYNAANTAMHPWPTFHGDNRRSGCAAPLPPLVNASIVGIVTRAGQPVIGAKVSIYRQDGSVVCRPKSDPPVARDCVFTIGSTDTTERGRGAYCISQLERDQTYKICVEAIGQPAYWVENIAVTTGTTVVDVELP